MDRIRKLKAERAKLLSDAKALAAKSSEENRPMTEEERAETKELRAKIEKLDEDIKE
ncbi:MAG: hypothetical protein GTO09_09260, partial [Candidatus Latescibacteria bacterium]|nr:hypothetical protein [Candidatus Latescibacterota bacterium]